MAESKINALPGNQLGKYQRVTGTYTTASWSYGSTGCSINIEKPGLYLAFIAYSLQNASSSAHRAVYKQLQIQTSGTNLLHGPLYYDTGITNGDNVQCVGRTACCPILITQANQYIRPYVHTGTANIVFDVIVTVIELT